MEKQQSLNYRCFISQFPHECDISEVKDILTSENRPDLEEKYGVEIFRCLNKIIIKHDGKFWSS